MSEGSSGVPERTRHAADRSSVALVFVLVVVFSYSEVIISGVSALNSEYVGWRWFVLLIGVLIIAATGLLKRRIANVDVDGNRLWGWWALGACLAIAVELVLLATGEAITVWGDLVASTLFVVAMGILLISALNGDPDTVLSPARRRERPADWKRARSVIPLIVGTYAGYIAATIWTDVLNVDVARTLDTGKAAEVFRRPVVERLDLLDTLCAGAINPEFFAQMCGVIPLLLIALGIEFGYFRQAVREPAARAATIITVGLLCIGLGFALSALLKTGTGCGEVLTGWHEYLAFVMTVQSTAIGLAMLVWLLVVQSLVGDDERDVAAR